jgi:hypothetical protein
MKQMSKILSSAALAAAALSMSQAHAAGQFASVATYKGDGTYIGIMDPTVIPTEDATIKHTGLAQGSFTDWWVVDIIPTGNTSASLSFLNISNSFSAFSVSLFLDQAPITNLANARYTCLSSDQSAGSGVLCATGPGSLTPIATTNYSFGLGTSNGGAGASTVSFLTAGRYVVQVTGTVVGGTGASYSGDVQVNQIPEPGTLALAGLALLGTAAAMRKRQSA